MSTRFLVPIGETKMKLLPIRAQIQLMGEAIT